MFIMSICPSNLEALTALNNGVPPQQSVNEWGGIDITYLVVEAEKPNRIIDHHEWLEMRESRTLKTFVRKFHTVS
jgi:hypothetical protein